MLDTRSVTLSYRPLAHREDTEEERRNQTSLARNVGVVSRMQLWKGFGVTPPNKVCGRSRDPTRINFDVSTKKSISTIQFFTPITRLWSGNFYGFFDGKRKNFGVVDAKLVLL